MPISIVFFDTLNLKIPTTYLKITISLHEKVMNICNTYAS